MTARQYNYMTSDYAFTADELGTLDPRSFVPLYMQLAECMSALIRNRREAAIGKLLPSEAECAERLQISRPTVRQAMAHLLSQGLIMREKGRGTFVAPLKLEHDVTHAFEDDMHAAHQTIEYEVLDWTQLPPPPEVAAVFGNNGSDYYVLRRTRSVSGQLVGLEERYLPLDVAARIQVEHLTDHAILGLVERAGGPKPARLNVEVSSIGADRSLARVLGIRPGTPLLQRTTTFLASGGRPFMHGTVTFLGDRYTFRFSVNYSA
jgi:GntR family transcriptional regulator